jgi:hypothetical protein
MKPETKIDCAGEAQQQFTRQKVGDWFFPDLLIQSVAVLLDMRLLQW